MVLQTGRDARGEQRVGGWGVGARGGGAREREGRINVVFGRRQDVVGGRIGGNVEVVLPSSLSGNPPFL